MTTQDPAATPTTTRPPLVRSLGRSGITVSALGAGCWAIGGPFWAGDDPHGWGEVDDEESVAAVHAALDAGITFFDTADVYGAGHSERILARALRGHRDDVVIATKFGNLFDERTRQVTGQVTSGGQVRPACLASLDRLGTDRIDLLQFHLNDHPLDAAAEIRDACEALVTEGLVRAYGWSTDFPDRAEVFAAGPHCATVQLALNVFEDNPAVLSVADRHDLAAINRGPLAMGLLTGKYSTSAVLDTADVRYRAPSWLRWFRDGRADPAFLGRLESIREILTSDGRTLAQGALAWLWARSPRTVPIPGFRTVAQVTENAGAMAHGPLTPDQMHEIDGLLERSPVLG
jgi:aryl-alcohol dehydrogenase-like predicted oxidoreductase